MGRASVYRRNAFIDTAIRRLAEAHERYQALESVRTECSSPQQREQMPIALLRAYLELQHHARIVAGLQVANGTTFA